MALALRLGLRGEEPPDLANFFNALRSGGLEIIGDGEEADIAAILVDARASLDPLIEPSKFPLIAIVDSEESGLAAIQTAADDFIQSTSKVEEIALIIQKCSERRAPSMPIQSITGPKFIVESPSMVEILATIERLAAFSTTVLITGESGTGKELIAREIHTRSPRHTMPFVAINCGAIPEGLVESELFGHKKGSFTDATRDKKGLFEEANGGTIFLDEIGELPLHLQVKLLRALQEQQIRRVGDELTIVINVRVIAATLRDLEDDVLTGRFRDDLFYRLNVVSIDIPPLRERREEIPPLVDHFIKKHNKRLGLKIRRVTPEALEIMSNYRWRGNVRELENCVERAMVLTDSDAISVESLPEHILAEARTTTRSQMHIDDDNLSIKQRTRDLEIGLITRALEQTKGNRTHAAKILEISHRALLYKLKEYGIS